MSALTQEDLNGFQCDVPGCEALHEEQSWYVLSAKCHAGGPTITTYDPGTGNITVQCFTCRKPVSEVAVAPDRKVAAVRSRMARLT